MTDYSVNQNEHIDFVICTTFDGYSLHAPGSSDEDIADGSAPALAYGPWSDATCVIPGEAFEQARKALAVIR